MRLCIMYESVNGRVMEQAWRGTYLDNRNVAHVLCSHRFLELIFEKVSDGRSRGRAVEPEETRSGGLVEG